MIKHGKSLQRRRRRFQPKILIQQLIAPLGSLWLIDIAADYDTEHHPTVGGEELGESRLTELRGTHLAESTEHSCKVLLGLESTCNGYI